MSDVLDSLLGLSLVALAWRALASEDLFKAVVLFISFGLVLALVWVRLEAPDIALAEAAIGAGLTGALLLAALARLRRIETNDSPVERPGRLPRMLTAIAALSLTAALGHALLSLPTVSAGLSREVIAQLDASGVRHPVTAVLLNFRGYDTLLELMVLLLALLGAWSLRDAPAPPERPADPVLDTLAHALAPLLLLVAAYLLWAGAHAPGGAFQAGAVLAAAGVLLLLAGWRLSARLTGLPLRLALVLGPGVFLLVAVFTVPLEGLLLEFPPAAAGRLILLIEAAAMISIAVTLAALFLGAPPERGERR